MLLDQFSTRAFADHGGAWNNFAGAAVSRVARTISKGVTTMVQQSFIHLRNLAVLMAVLVASAGFVGVAVLPGLVALGVTA